MVNLYDMKPRRRLLAILTSFLIVSCLMFALATGAQRTTQPAQKKTAAKKPATKKPATTEPAQRQSRARSTSDEALRQQAQAIHRRAIIIDITISAASRRFLIEPASPA